MIDAKMTGAGNVDVTGSRPLVKPGNVKCDSFVSDRTNDLTM